MTNNTNIKKHLKIIIKCMLEKKASEIKIIYVDKLTSLTDIFIICTSNSDPQTKAIVNHIIPSLQEQDIRAWHIEGYQHLNWVLMDYVNIVINIFNKDTRKYYDIERLWADAKIELIEESFTLNEK
jgi:ribosome-associated protein